MASFSDDDDDYTIVLFYQYVCAPLDVNAVVAAQQELCGRLGLRGRVRVAPEGLNGTLGGAAESIETYMAAVDAAVEFEAQERPIHWKLSQLRDGVVHQPFTDLSVKAVKEVVSTNIPDVVRMDVLEIGPGEHISPQAWHEKLLHAASSSTCNTPTPVLIDVRNRYETRIGKFVVDTPAGPLQPMDPGTRQFSEFAKFVDRAVDSLNGRDVLMYCTGGVRCERASAYVKLAVARAGGTANIFQLHGGIHAYQSAYPDGGFFRGKRFEFDPRIAVPSRDNVAEVIGRCLLCDQLHDDYSRQLRCKHCRLLVLVCDACAGTDANSSGSSTTGVLVCETCRQHAPRASPLPSPAPPTAAHPSVIST